MKSLILLFCFYSTLAYTQESKVTWGKIIKPPPYINGYLGADNDLIYFLGYDKDEVPCIISLSGTSFEKKGISKPLFDKKQFKDEKFERTIETFYNPNGTITHIIETNSKKEKTRTLHALNFPASAISPGNYKVIIPKHTYTERYHLRRSPDNKTTMLFKVPSKEEKAISYHLLDTEFNEIRKGEIPLKEAGEKIHLLNIAIDDYSNIAVVAVINMPKDDQRLTSFQFGKDLVKRDLPVDLTDALTISLNIDQSNNIFITGLKRPFQAFAAKIDPLTRVVAYQKNTKIDESGITDKNIGISLSAEGLLPSGKVLSSFSRSHSIPDSKGGIYIVSHWNNRVFVKNHGHAGTGTIHDFYRDVLVMHFDKEGNFWQEIINLDQHINGRANFGGSITIFYKGNLCVFYIDHPDNMLSTNKRKPLNRMIAGHVYCTKFNSDGKKETAEVFSPKKDDADFEPDRTGLFEFNDQLHLLVKNGYKYKIGKIKLQE